MRFLGITPYLYYDNAAAALDWLARAFGFEEIGRYLDEDGAVRESEMRIGEQELWLNGSGPDYWQKKGYGAEQLILIWVDDLDEHYARFKAAGFEAEAPEDKPYCVRMYTATDPEGYKWGFMQRLGTEMQLQPGWTEIIPGRPPRGAAGS